MVLIFMLFSFNKAWMDIAVRVVTSPTTLGR
jgi:hypothetical protein